MIALALVVCLFQEPSIDDLIRRLESDSLQERDEAQRKLKARGREALPQLEKASQRVEPEVAARAKHLVELVRVAEREHLTPDILAEIPELDEQLLSQGDQAWIRIFLSRVPAGQRSLKPATWGFIAPRAARSAKTIEDRGKIVDALGQVPIPEAVPELVPYFLQPLRDVGDPDELLKSAVHVMIAAKARRELYRVVTEYGDARSERLHSNPNIARNAFVGLRDLQARPELLAIARSEESFNAAEAVQALAVLEHPDRSADLLLLLSSKVPWTRHHAARGLVRLGVREAIPGLKALLAQTDGPSIRAGMEGLTRFGIREDIPRMLPFLFHPRSLVQVTALRSLTTLEAKEAVPGVQDLLTHKDPAVRAVAAESLGFLLGSEAVPDLLPLLQDPNADVRQYAAAALCGAGSVKGLPVLLRAPENRASSSLNVGDELCGGGFEAPPPPLLWLNALRAPETWKRVLKTSAPDGFRGTVLPDTELLAGLLSLKLEWSPELSRRTGLSESRYYYEAVPKGMRLSEVLNAYCIGDLQFLFLGATLRVVPQAEARSAWMTWYLAREPADAEDRAMAAAFKEELRRAALPPEERAALEARDKAYAKTLHRKERARALEGVLTPGLQRYEGRLLDGDDDVWAQIGRELLAKPGQDHGLTEPDIDVLLPRALTAIKNAMERDLPYKIAEQRIALLRLAKRRTGKDIPTWIDDLIMDPNAGMRAAALNLLDPKLHAKEIFGLSQDPSSAVRLVVATIVSETSPRESLDLMVALSLDPEWGVSDRAAQYLRYKAGPEQVPHMIKLLKRSTSNNQAADSALSYLGHHGAREAIPYILPLLEEKQARCRGSAMNALLELGARESMPRILGIARKDPWTLRAAEPLIEAFDVHDGLYLFYPLLTSEDNPFICQSLVLPLARMGDRGVLPTIRKHLRHEYEGVRAAACEALALLDGPAAREDVLKEFKNSTVTPAHALVLAEAREAVPELKKRLQGYSPEIIQALVDLGGRDALPQIFSILDKPAAGVSFSEGLKSIARAYPAESLPTLRLNLANDHPYSAMTAAAMLCEAGSTEGVATLLEKKGPTFSLNAVRSPDRWRKLLGPRVAGSLYGSGAQLLERVAGEAGLKVEGLPADAVDIKAWTNRHLFLPRGARPRSLIEVLDRLEDPRWAFIMEKETIRVVPHDAAVKFWTEWWASVQKK